MSVSNYSVSRVLYHAWYTITIMFSPVYDYKLSNYKRISSTSRENASIYFSLSLKLAGVDGLNKVFSVYQNRQFQAVRRAKGGQRALSWHFRNIAMSFREKDNLHVPSRLQEPSIDQAGAWQPNCAQPSPYISLPTTVGKNIEKYVFRCYRVIQCFCEPAGLNKLNW